MSDAEQSGGQNPGAKLGAMSGALEELLTVSRRAVDLSLKYPDFKLYAMGPMEQAIARATAALNG